MKKFYRIKSGKWIFGLCSGFGDYFSIDPIIFRLVFVFLTVAYPGLGAIFYLVASLITPLKKSE